MTNRPYFQHFPKVLLYTCKKCFTLVKKFLYTCKILLSQESSIMIVARDKIDEALLKHKGNISAAARELHVSRPTLYANMKRYGITVVKKVAAEDANKPVNLFGDIR